MKECGNSDFKTYPKGQWPKDDFWPHFCWGHMCDSTQGSYLSKSHENMSKYVDTVTLFFSKTWTKGHWPQGNLWLQVCWGHMCDSTQGSLCPSPMKIHQSMWIQWTFFSKTWTTGHWPLDDLWPYICWGHMCDSTQGSLCPSPMGIHQCMWIVINFAKYHILRTHYILHTMYILHVLRTEWVITQSLSELSSGKTKMSHVVLCNCPSLRHGKA